MSTQETAKFTTELTFSSNYGELPGDIVLEEIIQEALDFWLNHDGSDSDLRFVAVKINGRTGELE